MPWTLGKARKTLSKGFVECNTRQRAHDSYSTGKQRLCRVFSVGHSAKTLPRAENDTRQKKKYVTERKRSRHVCRVSNIRHSAKLGCLPCVKLWALGKSVPFVVCQTLNTRQSLPFCRVSKYEYSAKLAFLPCQRGDTRQSGSFLPCVKVWALGKDRSKIHRIWLLCRVS